MGVGETYGNLYDGVKNIVGLLYFGNYCLPICYEEQAISLMLTATSRTGLQDFTPARSEEMQFYYWYNFDVIFDAFF